MKYPKSFFKMSLQDQEAYLVDIKKKLDQDYKDLMRALATVRGGYKYEVREIDRPDLLEMKDEPNN